MVFALRRLFFGRSLRTSAAAMTVASVAYAETKESLEEVLSKLRPGEAEMRARWIKDEEGWRKLPPRAWPTRQPKADEISALRARLEAERCPSASARSMSAACAETTFDFATALTFNQVDPKAGLAIYKDLAQADSVDGMVATGVVLVEGIGVDRDDNEGLRWLRKAADMGDAQGQFELATLLFTGGAGLAEDEIAAYKLFEKAAAQSHSAGMFMVGDCLLEGNGCEQDPARAVPLLLAAAEKGHRGARQHIRQLLDGNWASFLNQSSRTVSD